MINFKIFPATLTRDGHKVPLIEGWQKHATNDPGQIALWQQLFRDRISFWGIPCGQINGIFVLDIDIKNSNGWESLKNLNLSIPPTLYQNTLSGGSHFLFKTKTDQIYPNTVNRKLGLDTRGDGGWIAFYGFKNDLPIAEIPDWLLKLVNRNQSPPEVVKSPITLSAEIAKNVFLTSIEKIRNAEEGERNNTLNIESFRIGQLIASNNILREFAEAQILKAAEECGLKGYEVKATMTSGLNGGSQKPLTCPFSSEEPVASFPLPGIPSPPETPTRWTPRYMTRGDLMNTSKLKRPQLFADWSSEDIAITSADGGTGKTTLKLYEAVCLALGERFLGFECIQKGKTLFITGEDTEGKLAAITGAILRQMGLFIDSSENESRIQTILSSILIKKDPNLCLITKDKLGFLHPNNDAMTKVCQAIEDFSPKLVVFDPIASFWGSESALNDMNKAVTRFMSELVEKYDICVEMINHIGKASSAAKDMSQYAGRGGSGLPSNSRISRVLRSLPPEEYTEMTGLELLDGQSAMLCNVNKFTDGSALFNKPFIVVREGYLFKRITLTPAKLMEAEKQLGDAEKVFIFLKNERSKGKRPTKKVIIGHFMTCQDPMSEARVKRAITTLLYQNFQNYQVREVDNPDLTNNDKILVIEDDKGKEIQ